MEIFSEKVELIEELMGYAYSAKTNMEGSEVDFLCNFSMLELRSKGAPSIMPYAEMALHLGRSKFRQLIREYS